MVGVRRRYDGGEICGRARLLFELYESARSDEIASIDENKNDSKAKTTNIL